MSGFLDKIAELTRARVQKAKADAPPTMVEQSHYFKRETHDVLEAFRQDAYNIIAEIKFASPSEGKIHDGDDPVAIAGGYLRADARMLSVLTEPQYFGGSLEYLRAVRETHPQALLLRKDFMVDPYQMIEAKAYGADAVLLIIAMTDPTLTRDLYQAARALSLTPLIEVHDDAELDEAIALGADFIGVNNRNLKTLKTDLDTSRRLATRKPDGSVFICESGLSTANDLQDMRGRGYDGFLMGTTFMRKNEPGAALAALQKELSCA